MEAIKEALTFDDVLLLPRFSNILPSDTDISLNLTKNIKLKTPFLSSAMDTVTESAMAIAIAKSGGIGIIHRNLDIKKQGKEVEKVKKNNLFVGAAIGTNIDDLKRAKLLIDSGVDLIVIDTAHGHSKKVLKTLSKIKKNKKIPKTPMLITGRVNPEIIEPPILEFFINKITKKQIKKESKLAIGPHYYEKLPKKYCRSFNIIKYKGLSLSVPNNHEEYLEYLYGKSWRKKAEFWSYKPKR